MLEFIDFADAKKNKKQNSFKCKVEIHCLAVEVYENQIEKNTQSSYNTYL